MNNKLTTILSISLPEELGGKIDCEIVYHIENDGIGHYEFWGAPGFDRGVDYVAIDDIIPIFAEDEKKQAEILQWIDENFEKLNDELCEQIETRQEVDDYRDEE
jgi:hypothetical protein